VLWASFANHLPIRAAVHVIVSGSVPGELHPWIENSTRNSSPNGVMADMGVFDKIIEAIKDTYVQNHRLPSMYAQSRTIDI